MKDEIMEEIARKMDYEAEKLRVFRDAARRRGDLEMASALDDKAKGFAEAARILRELEARR
jgi:hypothetical protein